MGKSRVATRRRRTSKTVRTAPIFPSQRRAARQQAAPLAAVSAKLTGKKRARALPRPVVWMLWLLGAAALSVAVGFVAGLARPRTRSENLGQSENHRP